MKKLEYYVPHSHLQSTVDALFAVGAGRIGDYDRCCWVTQGQGQFRPLAGSNAFVGTKQQVHYEPEYKVELVFYADLKPQVVAALKASHP